MEQISKALSSYAVKKRQTFFLSSNKNSLNFNNYGKETISSDNTPLVRLSTLYEEKKVKEGEDEVKDKDNINEPQSPEELEKLSNLLEAIYQNQVENYRRKQYKNVTTYIKNLGKYEKCDNFWKIRNLKLKCIQKIIENKISKYYNKNLSPALKWLKIFDIEITKWIQSLKVNEDDDSDPSLISSSSACLLNKNSKINEEKMSIEIELIISFMLSHCYLFAKFCMYQKLLNDTIAFLAIGQRIISEFSDFYCLPDSFYVSVQIFNFLSSLYITNENYKTAINCCLVALRISYKELEMRLNHDKSQLICITDLPIYEQENIKKIFFNITISFFHLAVSNENLGELQKASDIYSQCLWFNKFFDDESNENLKCFFRGMKKRSFARCDIIDFFRECDEQEEKEPQKVVVKKDKIFSIEEEKAQRFEKIQKYVEGIKIKDIDDEDYDLLNHADRNKMFSKKVGQITKTVHLLNYLMSDNFKRIVKDMDKININNLDNETKGIIQKKIIKIKNCERMKILKEEAMKSKSTRNNNNFILPSNMSSHNQSYNISSNNNKSFNNSKVQLYRATQNNRKNYTHTPMNTMPNMPMKKNNTLSQYGDHESNITLLSNYNNNSKKYKNKFIVSNNYVNKSIPIRKKFKEKKESNFICGHTPYLTTTLCSDNQNLNHEEYNTIETDQTQNYSNTIHQTIRSKISNLSINKSLTTYRRDYIETDTNATISSKTKMNKSLAKRNDGISEYSRYLFNKSFRNKIKTLDKQFDKEMKFQKKLLASKKEERVVPFKPYVEREIIDKCEDFYKIKLSEELANVREKEKKKNENNLIKKIACNEMEKSEKNTNTFSKMFGSLMKNAQKKAMEESIKKANEANDKYLKNLQNDLNNVELASMIVDKRLKKLKEEKMKRKHY